MKGLHSDVLLRIIQWLNALEMVMARRVCKEWLDVIDENKSLWRRLVLPKKEGGWNPSIVELFDRKSGSGLKEVSINPQLDEKEIEPFVQLLEKNKETLQILHLLECGLHPIRTLSKLSWKLPRLFDCRIISEDCRVRSKYPVDTVKLRMTGELDDQEEDRSFNGMTKFKVLWLESTWFSEALLESQPQRLDQIVSLKIIQCDYPSGLTGFLTRSTQSLKHLDIIISDPTPPEDPPTLSFPNMEALIIDSHDGKFPSWIKIPSSALVNCNMEVLSDLPRARQFWLDTLWKCERLELENRYPDLVDLRLAFVGYDRQLDSEHIDTLVEKLRQRKENVNKEIEIEGVRMVPLKRLLLPFRNVDQKDLSELQQLVEELVDLETVDRFIEVEI